MKKILWIMVAILALTNAVFAADSDAHMIKKSIDKLMQENNIPGMAVTVVNKGKATSYYFGNADDAKKIPVSKNTIFEVGSISKLMTTLILAQQVDFAKTDLDTSITHYLPNLPTNYKDITMRNLATHTSGLPFKLPKDLKTQTEVNHYLQTTKPLFSADQDYLYSNIGIGLLSKALEKISHTNIEKLYQRNIQKPLQMSIMTFNVPAKSKKWVAVGHDAEGKVVPSETLGFYPASGDLKMSTDAMAQFLLAAVGNKQDNENIMYPMRLTQSAFIKLRHKKQGLGWQIHSLQPENISALLNSSGKHDLEKQKVTEIYEQPKYDGSALIDKTGATSGFRTYVAVIPYKEAGIALLANKQVLNDSFVKTAREILFKLNDIKAEDDAKEDDVENN